MSAMRIMTKGELYQELAKHGFVEIPSKKTAENTLWHHPKTNKYFPIPHNSEQVPDFILDRFLSETNQLYKYSDNSDAVDRQYAITEKSSIKPILIKN
jgi:predicted RNA binding protein YcfA (HicA-like mRNA interferase family)